jgi:hypothetical protein
MGLYLVLATNDLRSAVSQSCTSYYMPFDRLAVVSYDGDADGLARRLDLGRSGGPGTLVGCVSAPRALTVAAGLVVAGLSYGMLT